MAVDLVAKARTLREYYRGIFDRYEEEIQQALPNGIKAGRFIQHALITITKKPELFSCTKSSIVSAVMTAASLGLLIDDDLGECFLIKSSDPLSGQAVAQLLIGYQGFCVLALRSGFVSYIRPRWVHKGDDFKFSFGLNEELHHVPGKSPKTNDNITDFYVMIYLKDGTKVFNVMSREEVEQARDNSPHYKEAKDKNTTVWHVWFNWMGNKTVLRSEMKYIPLSPEMQLANKIDEMLDSGVQDLTDSLLKLPEIDSELEKEIVEDREIKSVEKRKQAKKNQTTQKVTQAMEDLHKITKAKNG